MTAVPPNDEQFIRQLLDESDVDTSLPLRTSLLELRAAGAAPAPAPSAELAAFMAPSVVPLRRSRKAIKGTLVGLAVVAATGLGVSGVAAANPEFRATAGQAVEQVVHLLTPAGHHAPPQQAPAATTPGTPDQAQPVPAATDTQAPAGDRPSAGPTDTATAPAAGTGSHKPSTPAARHKTDPAAGRKVLPKVPDLPVPTSLPGRGGQSDGPGLKVPTVPRPTGPADLPDLPTVPALPDANHDN